MIIQVEDLVVRFGSAVALDRVSLSVARGEMVALVGPNGAGKSTLINVLSRIAPASAGRFAVNGRLAHVPEGRQLFAELSVDDNIKLGAWTTESRDTSWVYELFPELANARNKRAGALSGGQQQMVAVGRALMARPEVLAVDELSLGLAPTVVTTLVRHIAELHRRGMAVLLIEQDARLAFDMCSRAYVLEAGRIVAEGACAELSQDPRVADAYLGRGAERTA